MSEKLFTAMPVGMEQTMVCVFIGQINNSRASVRERTIPTERPPPVSEGSCANRYILYMHMVLLCCILV
jgi:hypothetical protein